MVGLDASPTTTRGRSRKRTWTSTGNGRASGSSRRRIQDVDLSTLLDGATARVPSRRPGRRAARAGAAISVCTPTTTSMHRSGCWRPASDLPISRFVYASSSSIYGDNAAIPMREDALPQPVSPYGVTKLAAEQLCHLYFANHGVPAVAVRYFTVYGPRQRPDMAFHRFLRAAMNGEPIVLYGDGEQTRDFTFVADAVAATIAAAKTRRAGARVQHRRRLAGDRERGARDRAADRRPPGDRAARAGAERRHARHIRRHRAGPRGSGLRARRCRSNRDWKRSIDGFRQHRRFCSRRPA